MRKLIIRFVRAKVKIRVLNRARAPLLRPVCHEIMSRAAGFNATEGFDGRKARQGLPHTLYVRRGLLPRLRRDVRWLVRQGHIRVSIDGQVL